MLPLHPRPQRCCRGEPVHGPSSFPLVTTKIDNVAGIDYSLVAPPKATADSLDGLLKVRLTPRIIHPHTFASDHLLPPPRLPIIPGDRSYDSTPFLSILTALPSPLSSSSPGSSHTGLPAIPEMHYDCSLPRAFALAAPSKQEALAQISTEALPFCLQVFAQISSP